MLKISEDGNYLPFAGLTVVCPLLPSEAWTQLPGRLTAVAGQWISPLPSSSYHATLLAGPCQKKLRMNGHSWEKYVSKGCLTWVRLHSILQEASFSPSSLCYSKLRNTNQWGVCIDLHLPDQVENDAATKLRELLRRSAEACSFETKERSWHVTLAYRRTSAGPIPSEVAGKIQKLVEACLFESLAFAPAALRYHPDMTAFVPLSSLNFWTDWEREALMRAESIQTRREGDVELKDEEETQVVKPHGRWKRRES